MMPGKDREPDPKYTKEYGKGDGEKLTPEDYVGIAAPVTVEGPTTSPESPEGT